MKLSEWMPYEFLSDYRDTPAFKLLDYDVIKEYKSGDKNFNMCPIKRNFIYNWAIVQNGSKAYAVAWNENPSRGWGFPIKKIDLSEYE